MTCRQLSDLTAKYSKQGLSEIEKEYVWETFKVKQFIEENPDKVDDRLVSLQALVNARKQTRNKKIKELLSIE